MMIDIGIHNLHKSFGYAPVLAGASFEVHTGDRVALVGKNGSGKTTLMGIVTGAEPPDKGTVSIRRGARLGYLAQIPALWAEGTTVRSVLCAAFAPLEEMEGRLHSMEAQMAAPGADLEALYDTYTELQAAYTAAGGYEMGEQFSRVSRGFGLEALLDSPFNTLSGGEKTVVSLAATLLKRPDILLLDEPTNHLDMATLAWFEGFVREWAGTVLLISHDRAFLDAVATKTVLLQRGAATVYNGNYTFAVQEQEREALLEFEAYKTVQKQLAAMQQAARRLRDWGERGDNPAMFKKAKLIERRMAQLEALERPPAKSKPLPLGFAGEKGSKEVLRAEGLRLEVPGRLLAGNITFTLYGGDRLLLAGNNGCGKTTLLRAILSGAPGVYHSPSARIGYIPQEIRFPNEKESLLRWFAAECTLAEGEARRLLARYGFYADSVFKSLKILSGGEKVLLMLAAQVQHGNNTLVLDEPTNHIDIATREILEEALLDFGGTLLFISHDKYFINKVATRALRLENGALAEVEKTAFT